MSNARICSHIKVTGIRCGSPALRGQDYCYFHYRMLCTSRISPVALLEDGEAIQVSIMEVVNNLLRGSIDVKRGELILRALNTAVRNSRNAHFYNRVGIINALPKDPVVQPRPAPPTNAEIADRRQKLEKEYLETNETGGVPHPSRSSKGGKEEHVGTAALGCPGGPDVPVRGDAKPRLPQSMRGSLSGETNTTRVPHPEPALSEVEGRFSKGGNIDPTQRKPPVVVKERPTAAKPQSVAAPRRGA